MGGASRERVVTEKRRGPGQPPKPPEERKKQVQFRLHPGFIARLDAACEAEECSRTRYVERAVEERLAKRPAKKGR